MAFEHVHFIINPAAGQPQPILHTLNKVLYQQGIAWTVSITQDEGSGTRQARQAVDAGADLVVAYGGDGTVKEVMNGLLDSEVPLGMLHGGTGNAMAYELGIPTDLTAATELILRGGTLRAVDVGTVTCDDMDEPAHFMLRASVGLQTQIVGDATRELKDQFGNLAYVMAGLRSLSDPESIEYDLTIDGDPVSTQGLVCMVTNSSSVGGPRGFRFAADVDPFDGMLDVFIFDVSFETIMNRLLGSDRTEGMQQWACQEIRVKTPSPLPVTLDGENFGQTPATISILPHAVQVLVPRSDEESNTDTQTE